MKRIALLILPAVAGVALIVLGIHLNSRNSASIGIIGGADGPTSILVTGIDMFGSFIACVCAGAVILVVCIMRIIKRHQK